MRANKDFCYLSNPKCGSSSVRIWIDSIWDCEKSYQDGGKLDRPLHGTEVHYRKVFGDIYMFTTIRNPWAKVVSHFIYDVKMSYTEEEDFESYLKGNRRLPKLSIDKFAPTVDIFKIEEANEIVQKFEKMFNKKLPPIGKKNVTVHPPYSQFYNSQTKDLVAKWYKEDIKIGNYEF